MIIRCEADGSRNSRRISPISEVLLGRSMSKSNQSAISRIIQCLPSMSDGLSRSILSIRPVERANTRTLLATWAATKFEEIEKSKSTGWIWKMGTESSSSSILSIDDVTFGALRDSCGELVTKIPRDKSTHD